MHRHLAPRLAALLVACAPLLATAGAQGTRARDAAPAGKGSSTRTSRPAPPKSSTARPTPARQAPTRSPTKAATASPTKATAKAAPAKPAAPVVAPVAAAPAVPAPTPLPPDAHRAARAVTVHEGPGGGALATLAPGAVVTPLARDGGWVKVRLEAWVQERDLVPADTGLSTQLAAADLRADPDGTRGRMVRWEVELLAFQTADPLRRELATDEPYLLVRGPGSEDAMLYLALPPSLVETGRGLPPLSRLLVTARVRSGRSAPAGIPVLDIVTLTPLRRG